jgi:ABC-type branched-subunit amino acid transport system substrate-binding protein
MHRPGRHGFSVSVTAIALICAACGSSGSSSSTTKPAETATTTATTVATTAATAAPSSTAAAAPTTTAKPAATTAAATSGKATGPVLKIGLVNTEGGAAGLDFPDIRLAVVESVKYLNEHGGFGGRALALESCAAKGSPETSQACAQELVGKKVDLILLGLDLFPDYKTYTAAGLPVIGVLPILPGDYVAEAKFLTGGNATTTASMAAVARDHLKAKTAGIVSADNAGANGTAAALEAALDKAGITHKIVKGGDNETDAGYQGLLREAAKDKPDVIFNLYANAGCIGVIRGRVALGITTPVITTSICSGKEVLDVVGQDAAGWLFAGVQSDKDTPQRKVMQQIMAPVLKLPPEKVAGNVLGLGGLGFLGTMSLADYANAMAKDGKEVTAKTMYDYIGTTKGLKLYGDGALIECGASAKYPAICSFTFPYAELTKGGTIETIKGLEAVSAKELLP